MKRAATLEVLDIKNLELLCVCDKCPLKEELINAFSPGNGKF